MPPPSPAPTTEEIAKFSAITFAPLADVLGIVSAFDQAMADHLWSLTLDDLDDWNAVDAAAAKKILTQLGPMKWSDKTDPEAIRLAFRNKIRRRYALDALLTDSGATGTQVPMTSLPWY